MMPNYAKPILRLGDFCYYIVQDGEQFQAVLVVRDEAGYYPMPWRWGANREEAEKICAIQNARLGITHEEQNRIVGSSMNAHRRRRRI